MKFLEGRSNRSEWKKQVVGDPLFRVQSVPLRGNRVITVLEGLAALASILLFVGGLLGIVKANNPTWAVVLVVWLIMLATALILLVYVQEKRVGRRTRYALATAATHGAEHRIRDAEAGILNRDADFAETVGILRSALNEVSRTFSVITGSPCRACVKQLYYEREDEAGAPPQIKDSSDLRDIRVETLCRDDVSRDIGKSNDQPQYVSDNTDFELLFLDRERYPWYFSNDLTKENPYKNSSWTDGRPKEYRSTCVWPIQKTDDTEQGKHDTLGFLCVDSNDVNIFDPHIDFHVGAQIADSLYPLLRLIRLHQDGVRFAAPVADRSDDAASSNLNRQTETESQ